MMSGFEASVRYRSWRPHAEAKTGAQRYERPVFDHASKTSPCREACPTGHDIAQALFLVARGRPDLACRVFREESPFPAITGRVCYHPCESPCNRGAYDQPLAIAALERVVAEHAADDSPSRLGVEYDTPVAVVGSGPAGLACAYHLRRLGHPVTVYEATDEPGGALRHGIPSYRLPRPVLEREIARLEAQGVRFRCGQRLGGEVSLAELRRTSGAVFLGVGLSRPRRLAVPGADAAAVRSGLELLRQVNDGARVCLGRRVVVIGGGDVAVDVARVALRLGATEVTMCAVESERELPAHPEEVVAARQEGARLVASSAPVEIFPLNGALSVALARVIAFERRPDGSVSFETSRTEIEQFAADSVVYAIGQELEHESLPEELGRGARFSSSQPSSAERSMVARTLVIGEWGETALPGIFAGGDASGTYSVAQALGAGKRAAIGIDLHLGRRREPDLARRIGLGGRDALSFASYVALLAGRPEPARERVVQLSQINLDHFRPSARAAAPERGAAERVGSFAEVAGALDAEQATREARRCFHCGACTMCGTCFTFCPDAAVVARDGWGFTINLDHCKGCGVCVEECPRGAMSMVAEEES